MSAAEQAFAMLKMHHEGEISLSARAGSFLGQVVVDPAPFTEKQAAWFETLLKRAGLLNGVSA